MNKPLIIIGTQRTGGTAYSKLVSQQTGWKFINEPWTMKQFGDNLQINFNVPGEGIERCVPEGNCVIHTISGHFLTKFGNNFPDADYRFIKRKDTWSQLLSFVIMRHTLGKHGLHNINIKSKLKFDVNLMFVQTMFYEWIMFDFLIEKFSNPEIVYYEDIEFPKDLVFKKNQGYENLIIGNLEEIRNLYEEFWANRS